MKRKSLLVGSILSIITMCMYIGAYVIIYGMMLDLDGQIGTDSLVFDEHFVITFLPVAVALVGLVFDCFSLIAGFKDNEKFSKRKWLVVVAVVINVLMTAFFVYKTVEMQGILIFQVPYIVATVATALSVVFLLGSCFYSKKSKK